MRASRACSRSCSTTSNATCQPAAPARLLAEELAWHSREAKFDLQLHSEEDHLAA